MFLTTRLLCLWDISNKKHILRVIKPWNNMLFITSRSQGRFLEEVIFNLYTEAKKSCRQWRNLVNGGTDFTQGMVCSENSMSNFRQVEWINGSSYRHIYTNGLAKLWKFWIIWLENWTLFCRQKKVYGICLNFS